MPPDATIDKVLLIISGGLLAMGLGSALLGWLVRAWDRVKTFQPAAPIMSREIEQVAADEQTDTRQTMVSDAEILLNRTELDRTRSAWVMLMVYKGYTVGEIRGLLKGDNGAIGVEIEAARQRLGIVGEPRQLRVRDAEGERMIPIEG